MNRRSFVGAVGGFGMLASAAQEGAAGAKKTRLYVVENFYLKSGDQLPRLHDLVSKAVLPAMNAIHAGPKLYLEAVIASHVPQFAAIYGFESLEQMETVYRKLLSNPELMKKLDEFERGPDPPYETQSISLLTATDYSPEIEIPTTPPATPRLFELRVYHSPTRRQLRALHERFAGPEIKIFHRAGIHPILYSSTIFGANMPNLTYLIPFDSLAAREKAWATFGADAEWTKVRQESIDKYGQIVSVLQISLFKATPYSPVR